MYRILLLYTCNYLQFVSELQFVASNAPRCCLCLVLDSKFIYSLWYLYFVRWQKTARNEMLRFFLRPACISVSPSCSTQDCVGVFFRQSKELGFVKAINWHIPATRVALIVIRCEPHTGVDSSCRTFGVGKVCQDAYGSPARH